MDTQGMKLNTWVRVDVQVQTEPGSPEVYVVWFATILVFQNCNLISKLQSRVIGRRRRKHSLNDIQKVNFQRLYHHWND